VRKRSLEAMIGILAEVAGRFEMPVGAIAA
jgi:hypothetical protein